MKKRKAPEQVQGTINTNNILPYNTEYVNSDDIEKWIERVDQWLIRRLYK